MTVLLAFIGDPGDPGRSNTIGTIGNIGDPGPAPVILLALLVISYDPARAIISQKSVKRGVLL